MFSFAEIAAREPPFRSRLAPKFAPKLGQPCDINIIEAPKELPELPFYSVWHPRLDNDPSRRWLRDVTRAAAAS